MIPRPALAALAGFLALALVPLHDVILGGRVLFQRDISLWWLPQVEALVRAVASGCWPVWDPLRGFGQPLLADPSAEALYPPTWLNLLLRPGTYYTLFVTLHLTLSALGLAALARRHGASPPAAFVAGGVWLLCGPLLSLVPMTHHLAGACWMPWVLLAADRALESPSRRRTLALAGVLAGQVLAGSADMTALSWLAAALDAGTRRVRWRRVGAGVSPATALGIAAAAAAVALGVTAAQWLPTLEVALRSARAALPEAERTVWSVHPLSLLELPLWLRFNDLLLAPRWTEAILEQREPWLRSLYLGPPAAALALAGLAAAPRRRAGLAALGLGALLVALGRHAPVYGLAVALAPPLRILRYPVKAMLVAALAFALLAGLGVDAWRGEARRGRFQRWVVLPALALLGLSVAALLAARAAESWGPQLLLRDTRLGSYSEQVAPVAGRLLLGALTAAAAGALALTRSLRPSLGPGLALAAAVLALSDLGAAHARIFPTAEPLLFAARPEALRHLAPGPSPRVYVYDYSVAIDAARARARHPWRYGLARLPAGWSGPEALALGVQMYLNPPTAGRWGVSGSYDIDLLGLAAAPLARLPRLIRESEADPARHLRLLQLGAVDNVLTLHEDDWTRALEPVATLPGLFHDPIRVFRVPGRLPRSYAVGGARVADDAAALELLTDPGFDPAREVILAQGPGRTPPSGFSGRSRIAALRADRVLLEAELSHDGWVVLVDAHDAGWRATLDGRPAPLLRANVGFRAVPAGAGRHVVELAYRPRGLLLGLALSGVTLVAAAALALRR